MGTDSRDPRLATRLARMRRARALRSDLRPASLPRPGRGRGRRRRARPDVAGRLRRGRRRDVAIRGRRGRRGDSAPHLQLALLHQNDEPSSPAFEKTSGLEVTTRRTSTTTRSASPRSRTALDAGQDIGADIVVPTGHGGPADPARVARGTGRRQHPEQEQPAHRPARLDHRRRARATRCPTCRPDRHRPTTAPRPVARSPASRSSGTRRSAAGCRCSHEMRRTAWA